MRAAVFETFGEPARVLTPANRPELKPGPGQVLVRMHASPVNPSDLMMIRGLYGRLPSLPATPGFEGVGTVAGAGPGLLGRLLVGRRVAVLGSETGTWAEYSVVAARQVVPLSRRIDDVQGAMFFVNPATAYLMTRAVLRVPRGGWLVQSAANSALGKMVIRLGRHYGFRTLNLVRRADAVDQLTQLGADHVAVWTGGPLADQLRPVLGEGGIQYAIDPVGGETATALAANLGPDGRLLLFGSLTQEPAQVSPRHLLSITGKVEGFWLARYMPRQGLFTKLRIVRTISRLIAGGVLASPVAGEYPLDQVKEAVEAAEQSGRNGKILLRM